MDHGDLPERFGDLMRHGRIESADLAKGLVTVRIGDIVTQPLRWYGGAQGATRVWLRPTAGEQVTLIAPEGDIEGAVAMRGLHSDENPPIGEADVDAIDFPDGGRISYNDSEHLLQIRLPDGARVEILASGGVSIDGDLAVTGTITADGDVKAGDISLTSHRHGNIAAGDTISGSPQ